MDKDRDDQGDIVGIRTVAQQDESVQDSAGGNAADDQGDIVGIRTVVLQQGEFVRFLGGGNAADDQVDIVGIRTVALRQGESVQNSAGGDAADDQVDIVGIRTVVVAQQDESVQNSAGGNAASESLRAIGGTISKQLRSRVSQRGSEERLKCYLGLWSPSSDSTTEAQARTSRIVAELARFGFSILGISSRHVVVYGSKQLIEQVFKMSVQRGPDGGYRHGGRYTVPAGLASYVRSLILPLPMKRDYDGSWPNPPSDWVDKYIDDNKVVKYLYGKEYGGSSECQECENLLFLSDVQAMHGITEIHKSGFAGQGVTVYVVDTGVDLSHPFFSQSPSAFNIEILNVFDTDAEEEELGDIEGHGTMTAAAALTMAPLCSLRPMTWPKDFDDLTSDINPADTIHFTAALNRVLERVPKDPHDAVVSISFGFDYKPEDPDYLETFNEMLYLVVELKGVGVPVFSSSGNWSEDWTDSIQKAPQMLEDVISVGGAYPLSNKHSLESKTWIASNAALSGTAVYNDWTKWTVAPQHTVVRRYPDLCGIVGMQPSGMIVCLPVAPSLFILPSQVAYLKVFEQLLLYDAFYSPTDGTAPNDGWLIGSGTSFACPCVAGIAAVFLSRHPGLLESVGIDGLRLLLQKGCVDVQRGVSGAGHKASSGQDSATGAGVLNAEKLWYLKIE